MAQANTHHHFYPLSHSLRFGLLGLVSSRGSWLFGGVFGCVAWFILYTAAFIPAEPWIILRVCWFAFKFPETTVGTIA